MSSVETDILNGSDISLSSLIDQGSEIHVGGVGEGAGVYLATQAASSVGLPPRILPVESEDIHTSTGKSTFPKNREC